MIEANEVIIANDYLRKRTNSCALNDKLSKEDKERANKIYNLLNDNMDYETFNKTIIPELCELTKIKLGQFIANKRYKDKFPKKSVQIDLDTNKIIDDNKGDLTKEQFIRVAIEYYLTQNVEISTKNEDEELEATKELKEMLEEDKPIIKKLI